MYLEDVYAVGANVAGLPAISVPCGAHEGLPVGLHFIGKMGADGPLLSMMRVFEHINL